MAIEKRRMQQRYGTYEQFQSDLQNILDHEFISVDSGDTTLEGTTKGLYFKFPGGNPVRIYTTNEIENYNNKFNYYSVGSGGDLDTIKDTGFYNFAGVDGYSNIPDGQTSKIKGTLLVVNHKFTTSTDVWNINQYWFSPTSEVFARTYSYNEQLSSGSWTSWILIATDINNIVEDINIKLNKKENVSNKINTIDFPSATYYPSSMAVWDYVTSKLSTPLADIETLKSDKLDKTDFNSYKTSNDNAVNSKVDTTDFNAYKTATDKAVGDNADNIKLLDTNKANVIISNTKDKATSNVLTDSSSHNIKNLSLYGNSVQSAVPTPTAPVTIENVNNPKITLYRKNLFDTSKVYPKMNSKSQLVEWDRQNCSITFTTDPDNVNSGPYFTHTTLINVSQGYEVDYTKLNGKSVTLSFDVQSDIECKLNVQFASISYTSVNISSTKQRFSVTEVVDINKLNKALCFYFNNVEATVTISNIQIEVGSIATDYEVCDVNKVEINCTLCKVNNIVDTLTVNADGTGYITQNLLYERIKSGRSQSWHIWKYSTTSKRFYRDDTRYKTNGGTPNLLCSHFEAADNEKNTTLDETIGFTSSTGTGVAIRMLQLDGDISAFENWLDNNEVYILIPLKQPIITELSKAQVDKILSLYTYYPSTTVVSDCDSQLTYVADTKNYIDSKFNELATAIVAHESEVN